MNSIYSILSRIRPLSKSYTSKFLFVAFLGIHIPLIGLIFFLGFRSGELDRLPVFLITLILTLLATGTTLIVLRKLLAPMNAAKNALDNYLSRREMPNLPSGYKDEAGVLMRQVQETIQLLDAVQDEQRDLIGLLSKDLRTPLSTIISLGQQLDQEPQMEAALRKKLAAMIAEGAQDQVDRFKQMLAVLRKDEISRSFLRLELITPDTLAAEVIRELQPQARRKNISLQCSTKDAQPFSADAMLLSQVIKNLVGNAVKYSPNDAAVQLTMRGAGSRVVIEVVDRGQGFEPAAAQRLFERLSAEVSDHGGTPGLGLYLAQKIVRAHNGTIRAESAGANRGARFVVELPAGAVPA